MQIVKKDISGDSTFTTQSFSPPRNPRGSNFGEFSLSISGTWTGTVSLQRSFDGGSSWHTVNTFQSNQELYCHESVKGVKYRIGIESGNYTNGTATVRLLK